MPNDIVNTNEMGYTLQPATPHSDEEENGENTEE